MKATSAGVEALRESLFDNTLNGLAYCQMLFDVHGEPIDFIYIEVNKRFEELTGLKDVVGKKASELIPGISTSNPELLETYGQVASTGVRVDFETYIRPLSRWFRVSAYSPKVGFFVAIFENVTDYKEAQVELERARIAAANVLEDLQIERDRLALAKVKDEAILASIGEGLIVTDAKGRIVLVNKIFEKTLGWKEREVLGMLLTELVPAATIEDGALISVTERPINRVLTGNVIDTRTPSSHSAAVVSDLVYVRKDGTRFPATSTVAPVRMSDTIVGAVEVFRDVTKERELDRAKTEFISIASHQLRTPVSALRWLAEALQYDSQNFSLKQKTYLKDLESSVHRLVELVEGLLNVSKLETKNPVLRETQSVNISASLQGFLQTMELFAASKKHVLVFHNTIPGSVVLELNEKLVHDVLQNLISNAVEYSPENTQVTVTSEKTSEGIKVSVANRGPAIPKEDVQHMFEKFYRGKRAKEMRAVGSGLGLYIAKLLTEEMGGSIGFESEEGKDTVFWFTINTTQ